MRTPISYYGGKQSLMHYLLPLIPPHQVYTETFFGGGSLFWAKNPSGIETINDRLDICINFYKVLKTNYKKLKPLIDQSLISRTMHNEAKDICKGKIQCSDPIKRAWAFWYATNFSFANKIGGGYRYSNDAHTSVCLTLHLKKQEFTDLLVSRLEHVYIENADAVKVLKSRNTKDAFHYIDPPYMNADQGHYKGYTTDDFELLLEWCAIECKGSFLLSNYPSDILSQYVEKYGWQMQTLNHSSKHGLKQLHRKKMETIVFNYTPPAYMQAKLFEP